ncbi:MAG: amidohydrolase family protein [Bryobacterales bacterium]|nr:amidohydrolase family protein [Bryobacterales bacterium]
MPANRRGFLKNAAAAAVPVAAAQAAQPSGELHHRLESAIGAMECVDTHEHFYPESVRLKQNPDLFLLASHYLFDDLVCAGMPEESRKILRDPGRPELERWRHFEPYWKSVRLTGYGQALRVAVENLYGITEINASTLPAINSAIRRANRPGLYDDVLQRRAKIRAVLLEPGWRASPLKPDRSYLRLSRQFDRYIMIRNRKEVQELEQATGVSITNLASLKQAVDRNFAESQEMGMVSIKTTLAYHRDLNFHRVDAADAERDLGVLLRGERETGVGRARFENRPFRNLEDHMLRYVVSLADAHNLPVQVHTGTFAGHWNYITNSNPAHLTQLFFDFSNVRFDLFHMSFPYMGELAAITKLFPHVYADFCWTWVLSPAAAQRAMREFIDTVPSNKILGFGGDYWFPELAYAHLLMARRHIAQVMAGLVQERLCTETEAVELARMILHDNAAKLYGV